MMQKKLFNYPFTLNDVFLWFEETDAKFSHNLIVEKDWRWFLKEGTHLYNERNAANTPLSFKIPDHICLEQNILVLRNLSLSDYYDLFWFWNLILYPRVIKKALSTIIVVSGKIDFQKIILREKYHSPLLFQVLKDKIKWSRSNFFRIISKKFKFTDGVLPMTEAEKYLYQKMSEIGLNPIPQYRLINEYNDVTYDYRLDFAFENKKIYIECDDPSHKIDTRMIRDKVRTDFIDNCGWRGLRFDNSKIYEDAYNCALEIKSFIESESATTSSDNFYKSPIFLDDNFDKNQKDAVTHLNGPAVVIAGPGAGKTNTLIARASFLIQKGVKPETIVVITFSNSAVDELRQRMVKNEFIRDVIQKINISTIHSFCLKNVINLYYKNHNAECPSTLDDRVAIVILKSLYHRYKRDYTISMSLDEAFKFIRELQEYFIGPGAFENMLTDKNRIERIVNHWDRSFTDEELSFLSELYNEYQRMKEAKKQMDFGDMLYYSYKFLTTDIGLRKVVQGRYSHILVDEYQDTGVHIHKLIQAIAAPEDNIYVIGDDDQSIYGFRGAEPDVLLNFDMDYPNYSKFVLDINYRSIAPVIGLGNQVIMENTKRYPKTMKPYRNVPGNRISLKTFDNEIEEAAAIADEIKKIIIKEKPSLSHGKIPFAILLRTNYATEHIIEELLLRKVTFHSTEKVTSFYERTGVRHLISYLKIASFGRSKPCIEEWTDAERGILDIPARYFNDEAIEKFKDLLNARKNFFADFDIFVSEIHKRFNPRLHELKTNFLTVMDSVQKGHKLAIIIGKIRDIFGFDKFFLRHDYAGNIDKSIIEDLDKLVIKANKFLHILDLLDHIEKLGSRSVEIRDIMPYANVTTLHRAKGLEFDTVFIPMLNEGILPHPKNSDIEEERRLFYVGITRAMNRLYLSYNNTSYGKSVQPSIFLNGIINNSTNNPKNKHSPYKSKAVPIVSEKKSIYHDTHRTSIITHTEKKFKTPNGGRSNSFTIISHEKKLQGSKINHNVVVKVRDDKSLPLHSEIARAVNYDPQGYDIFYEATPKKLYEDLFLYQFFTWRTCG